jgi:predicted GNAT superfamily acetyltransferase
MEIRPVTAADLDAVHALNAAEVPKVGDVDVARLAALLDWADLALLAEDAQGLLGFVLAMAPGVAYDSANYRWFEARGTAHLYVDRVAVDVRGRRRGVGTRLYDAVEARARQTGRAEVTCEVNLEPRNEVSLAFHARRGFAEVGTLDHGDHRVAMLARTLD